VCCGRFAAIKKDHVDVIEASTVRHTIMQGIPHSISNKSTANPAIGQSQLGYQPQEPHHLRLLFDERRDLPSSF
jgi:hypothetical protein